MTSEVEVGCKRPHNRMSDRAKLKTSPLQKLGKPSAAQNKNGSHSIFIAKEDKFRLMKLALEAWRSFLVATQR